jgi:peptidoglycan/LPS O-acetylase OafA/YrhL
MLIMGALVGLICFLIGGAKQWDGSQVPFYLSLICFLLSIFMIPAYPSASYEVRGNGKMFPLNGPTWSLFFEYIGNILYAIFIRRLSNKALTLFVILVGGLHTFYSLANLSGYGSFGVGWTLDAVNLCGGMLRMLFPFSVGMLIARNFRPLKIKYSFLICSIILIAALFLPYIEGLEPISFNGLYESFCIVVLFPLILLIGASDRGENKLVNKTSNLLGELSYPLYIVHYPIMYLFYQWLIKNELYSLKATLPYAVSVVALSIFLAYLLLMFYDKPLRKRLAKKMQKTITSR